MFYIVYLIFIYVIFGYVESQSDGMSYLGLAYQGFLPCPDLTMDRYIGLPPDEENYWNGTLSLDNYPNIPEVRIRLTLDNKAVITIDRKLGRIYNYEGNVFIFEIFKRPPNIDSVPFHVQGGEGKPFPNVVSLKLNGLEICNDAKKFKPTLLGYADVAGDLSNLNENSDRVATSKASCGIRKAVHKQLIIEGHDSKAGDWPWHAAIYKYNLNKNSREYICGGSLVSASIIMTAAHCVTESGRPVVPGRLVVALGKHNLLGSDIGSQELTIFEVIVHPDFNATTLANDIALLKLSAEASFSSYVQPICLSNNAPSEDISSLVDKPGTVVGWGRWGFGANEKLSGVLQQGTMPVVSVTSCLASNPQFFSMFLTDKTFCAGYRNGTSVCNGDSGGGLFFSKNVEEDLQWHIRGIVSLSVAKNNAPICDPEHFVLFTDVSRYISWINSFITPKY